MDELTVRRHLDASPREAWALLIDLDHAVTAGGTVELVVRAGDGTRARAELTHRSGDRIDRFEVVVVDVRTDEHQLVFDVRCRGERWRVTATLAARPGVLAGADLELVARRAWPPPGEPGTARAAHAVAILLDEAAWGLAAAASAGTTRSLTAAG